MSSVSAYMNINRRLAKSVNGGTARRPAFRKNSWKNWTEKNNQRKPPAAINLPHQAPRTRHQMDRHRLREAMMMQYSSKPKLLRQLPAEGKKRRKAKNEHRDTCMSKLEVFDFLKTNTIEWCCPASPLCCISLSQDCLNVLRNRKSRSHRYGVSEGVRVSSLLRSSFSSKFFYVSCNITNLPRPEVYWAINQTLWPLAWFPVADVYFIY